MHGNVPVRIESQQHYIVGAGSVISFNDDSLTLILPLDGEDLVFIFSFGRDEEKSDKPWVKVTPHGDHKLELQFMNFDYDLGTGNAAPIEVGLINNKPLFFNYRIYSLADSECRLIHYTFYQNK